MSLQSSFAKSRAIFVKLPDVTEDKSFTGVSFETSYDALIGQIPLGLNVFAHSVEQYLKVANRYVCFVDIFCKRLPSHWSRAGLL